MANNFFKIDKGVTLAPQASVASPQNGDVYYDSARNTYVFRNNGQNMDLQKRSDVASAASLTSSDFTASVVQSSLIRLTGSTASDVHGLTSSADAKQIFLYNNTNQTITIKHQSGTESTAANRIITSDGQDLTLSSGKSIQLGYDSAQSRWIVLSTSESSASSSGTKNYIVNGDASAGTAGWTTYTSVLTVTAANVDTGGNTFTITGHGLPQGRRVQFTTSNTLPSPLAANTDYYVLNPTTNTFQVSTTIGGTAVDITTQGTGTHSVKPARPVVVAGSSTAVQIFSNTTSPLSGTADFLIQRTSPSMGEGVYKAFTIDSADQARVLQITFDYKYSSGTYNNVNTTLGTDSDMICLIQDVTNGTFIEPSSFVIDGVLSGAPAAKFTAVFQTASNSTSYRLLIHSTYDLRTSVIECDSFKVSPQDYAYGSPISDSISYTPTFSAGFGTPTNVNFRYRRDGDFEEYWGSFTTGTVAASIGSISLRSGASLDTNKIAINNTSGNIGNVWGEYWTSGTHSGAIISAPATNGSVLYFGANQTGANYNIPASSVSASVAASSTIVNVRFRVPILGQGSSIQMSNETSTRLVDLHAIMTSNQAVTANTTNIPFVVDTTINCRDSHGAWNGSVYTIPVPGDYWIGCNFLTTASAASISIYKNGTIFRRVSGSDNAAWKAGGILVANLVVGDQISLRADTSVTFTGAANGQIASSISILRLSGPSQIASSETVAACYHLSANFAASTTVPINFDTKEIDTHGAVTPSGTAWKFTAPISGLYSVIGSAQSATSGFYLLYKNGSLYKTAGGIATTGAVGTYSVIIALNAGEYIDIRPSGSFTITGGALSGNGVGNINIQRIGTRG